MRKTNFGKIIILVFVVLMVTACNFFNSLTEENEGIKITGLTLGKSSVSVAVGEMSYISVSVKPTEVQKDVILNWTYDQSIISVDAS